MTTWGERMASVVTACGPRAASAHSGLPYHRRLEKVKFGVPLDQVCKRDIPGPLLVMLLKINKEGPYKKDVFRAPGHQGNTRKLIHFLQQGRLVNIHSFSVNTIASVLKKFLRKIPGGIFGPANEALLFEIFDLQTDQEKLAVVQRVFRSLPVYSQHLLVLLIGTFRVIHSNSERAKTGMTAEALGVSVAPSFFHTCCLEGKIAKPEEVQKFKLATRITSFFIEHFGMRDLFGRENYEYYAKLTGRILKVEDEWIFFTYPPASYGSSSTEALDTTLDGGREARNLEGDGGSLKAAASTSLSSEIEMDRLAPPANMIEKSGSLEIIPENCSLDPSGRLSISLDDKNVSSPDSCGSPNQPCRHTQTLSMPPSASRGHHGDIKSYSCLPQWDVNRRHSFVQMRRATSLNKPTPATMSRVHQRQTERMRHRSEWFLSDPTGLVTVKCRPSSMVMPVMSPSSLEPPSSPNPMSGPPSLPCSRPPPLPSSHPPRTTSLVVSPSVVSAPHSLVGPGVPPAPFSMGGRSMSPHVSCDKMMNISSTMSATSPLPKSSLPTATRGQNFVTPPTAQADVRLRRRLSDKDKERRLVRRSSSKRKDKENGGGGTGKTAKESGNGSDSPAKTTSGSDLTGGNQSISGGNQSISGGNTVSSSLDLALTDPYTLVPDHHQYSSAHGGGTNICSPSSEENSGSNNPDNNRSVVALKRTSSADTGSSTIPSTSVSGGIVGLPVDSGSLPVQAISVSGSGNVSNNNHSLLCRTRSEDAASSSNEVSERLPSPALCLEFKKEKN